jgi:hypothetical protein
MARIFPIYNGLEVGTGRSRNMEKRRGAWGAGAGVIWFIGWLFTIGFANLIWWKIILGIVVWPLFLGQYLR